VHVANFDIVLSARQKLDQLRSLGADRATGCKNLDLSALRDVVLLMSASVLAGWDAATPTTARH
jgi:hypothetical protein